MNGRGSGCTAEPRQFHRVDLVHALGPTVDRRGIAAAATESISGARGDPVRRALGASEGQFSLRRAEFGVAGVASGKRSGMGVA